MYLHTGIMRQLTGYNQKLPKRQRIRSFYQQVADIKVPSGERA